MRRRKRYTRLRGINKRRRVGGGFRRIQTITPSQRGFVRTAGFYGRYGRTGELKFFETDVDDAVVAAGFNVLGSLNLIPQGVTESTRVGRKCCIKRVQLKLSATLPTTATAASTEDVLRIVLLLDKQANGANPANTDIVETSNYLAFNNLANSQRFKTLWSRNYSFNCSSGSGRGSTDTLSYGAHTRFIQVNKKCNIPVEFNATTGAITEIRSSNVILCYASKNGLVGIDGNARVRFSDGN